MSDQAHSIVCALTPEAIRARRAGLLPGLEAVAKERRALADGYQLVFDVSDDVVQRIATVIEVERQCCPWLRVELSVPPQGAPIVLTLSGPTVPASFRRR